MERRRAFSRGSFAATFLHSPLVLVLLSSPCYSLPCAFSIRQSLYIAHRSNAGLLGQSFLERPSRIQEKDATDIRKRRACTAIKRIRRHDSCLIFPYEHRRLPSLVRTHATAMGINQPAGVSDHHNREIAT